MSQLKRRSFLLIAVIIFMAAILVTAGFLLRDRIQAKGKGITSFDGQRAFQDIQYQVSLGPRTIGSSAHAQTIAYIQDQLERAGWQVEVQSLDVNGHPIQNVIAKRGKGAPWIILGAHYDSRFLADRDPIPANRELPVPGADDGASGVAVLLEIGRSLPSRLDGQIWLVFFDAEDNGGLMGWDWIEGSRAFVANLKGKPDAAVVVDMVGDTSLDIYMEANSNLVLKNAIWQQAADLGYTQFHPTVKNSIIDDHTPFLEAGIPAVDIIDINYKYWHTTSDTVDKVSPTSLEAVGRTVLAWVMKYPK